MPPRRYGLVRIAASTRVDKKLMAVFRDVGTGAEKTVHFGHAAYSDFTIHRDEARKQRYVARHSAREDWTDPTTAGALSYWILWNRPTLGASIADYKRRFGF